MSKHCSGASLRSPDGTLATNIAVDGFVDDCYSSSTNCFDSNLVTIKKLLKRAKFDSKLWSVKYHIIHYTFKPSPGQSIMMCPPTDQQRIEIDANDGRLVPVLGRPVLGQFARTRTS